MEQVGREEELRAELERLGLDAEDVVLVPAREYTRLVLRWLRAVIRQMFAR